MYKSKQDRSFKIVLKHIHATTNVNDIRKGIENQEYIVINIWNIKKQGTVKALPMFYVKLKLESNNKDRAIISMRLDFFFNAKFEPRISYMSSFCFRKARYVKIIQFLTIHAWVNLRSSNACYAKTTM